MGTDSKDSSTDAFFDNYISVEQFAELVGRKPRTIRNWCNQRKIPFIKAGSSIRFQKSSVDAWLASQEVKNVRRRKH